MDGGGRDLGRPAVTRAVNKGDRIVGDGMTAQSVFESVQQYGRPDRDGDRAPRPAANLRETGPQSCSRCARADPDFAGACLHSYDGEISPESSRTSPMRPAITWDCGYKGGEWGEL